MRGEAAQMLLHYAYTVQCVAQLALGDVDGAGASLMESAQALAKVKSTVIRPTLRYLMECQKTLAWEQGKGLIPEWLGALREGRRPEFGALGKELL